MHSSLYDPCFDFASQQNTDPKLGRWQTTEPLSTASLFAHVHNTLNLV